MSVTISQLDAAAARAQRDALSDVLMDCVHGGASVSFMLPFPKAEADDFWNGVIADVESGGTILFGGFVDGVLLGTVQLQLIGKPNQPHRAEIAKMLVHRQARRRGLGAALLTAAEQEAIARNRWLLVLDTVTGSAGYKLYQSCGWQIAGDVPHFALMPDGALCGTTFFYKDLRA
ncbi:MAG: GNAT family N-acetyltransferase [Beijerinckiaceae bacterium]